MNNTVSVIIPVYNVENYFEKCIQSVINQSFFDLDIILVDDGSVDNTSFLCDEFAKKDSRIRTFHKKNEGLSSARNLGIEQSKGQYLCFLDGDDVLNLSFVEKLYNAANKFECDIAQCDYYMVRNPGCDPFEMREPKYELLTGIESIDACYDHDYSTFNSACMKLYQKKLFSQIRFPVGRLREDEFTTWRVLKEASRIVYLHEFLYMYSIRRDSIMGEKNLKKHIDGIDAFCEKAEYYHENKYYRAAYRAYSDATMEIDRALDSGLIEDAEMVEYLIRKRRDVERMICLLNDGILFPFSKIKRGSVIAIYGAGRVGQAYYSQLKESGFARDIIWVDAYALRENENVESIDRLLCRDVDKVVVAIGDRTKAYDIINILQSMGLEKNKIVW